jgi:phosphoglucomutase
VIGGDGRYFNREVVQIVLRMASANGFAPRRGGAGGHALPRPPPRSSSAPGQPWAASSSRPPTIPGGPTEDFGIKYNTGNGGPAPERITEAIYARSREITEYRILEAA